jgi:hypothetical protein
VKEEAARVQINVAGDASTAAPSPARKLQLRLDRDLRAGAPVQTGEARWPLYAALTFWGGISSLMWAAIIGCVWLLLRRG